MIEGKQGKMLTQNSSALTKIVAKKQVIPNEELVECAEDDDKEEHLKEDIQDPPDLGPHGQVDTLPPRSPAPRNTRCGK